MDESIIKRKNKSFVNLRKEFNSPKQRSRIIIFHRPTGVRQLVKRKKRNALLQDDMNEKQNTIENGRDQKQSQNPDDQRNSVDDEFDSDEHIDNENDWYKHLDVVAMPHLLGPSATEHSPIPVEYQHLSTFPVTANPFNCEQILIQWIDSKPIITTVSCPMHYSPFHYSPYYSDPYYYNSPYYQSAYYNDPRFNSLSYQTPYH